MSNCAQVVDELIRISDQQRRAIVAHLQRRSAAAAAAAARHEAQPSSQSPGQHSGQGPGQHASQGPKPYSAPPSRVPSVGSLALLTPSLLRSPAEPEPCLAGDGARVPGDSLGALGTLAEDGDEHADAQGLGISDGQGGQAGVSAVHGDGRGGARASQGASAGGSNGAGPAGLAGSERDTRGASSSGGAGLTGAQGGQLGTLHEGVPQAPGLAGIICLIVPYKRQFTIVAMAQPVSLLWQWPPAQRCLAFAQLRSATICSALHLPACI